MTFSLPNNFTFPLSSFLSDKDEPNMYLYLEYISTNNNLEKKKIPNKEFVKITNIKRIKSAFFGINKMNSLDVINDVMTLMEYEQQLETVKKLSKKFESFCMLFLHILSPRCYNTIIDDGKPPSSPHNSGYINIIMKLTDSVHHDKLFDQLIKCFIFYLIYPKCITIKEKEVCNLLTHILLSNNTDEIPLYANTNIIHNYMVNGEGPEMFKNVTQSQKESSIILINIFYKHLYPALKYFHTHKNNVFIRHGLEKNTYKYDKQSIFPPNNDSFGWRINKVSNGEDDYIVPHTAAYPIEADKYPFVGPSMHSANEIYGNVKGYIASNVFKQAGGQIHCRYEKSNPLMARDHLFAESEIHINHWVFTYNIDHPENKTRYIKMALRSMLIGQIPFIADENLKFFNKIYEIIENKFILLI